MIWLIVWGAVGGLMFIFLLTACLNALTFPRLKRPLKPDAIGRVPTDSPAWSILIPARNEAAVIGETVGRVLAQSYPDFELLILDDHSEDGTGELARAAAQGDSRLRILSGSPLPVGWLGKNWACWQLAAAARGENLLFLDADVRLAPSALAAIAGQMDAHKAEMFTVWPTQETVTWGERLVIPMMNMVIMAYLPEIMVRFSPFPMFAAANGQCIAFRRATYQAVGGHEAVRANIVEDVGLARLTKQHGGKLVMVQGNGLVNCRMYRDWREVRNGFAKNILAGHGDSILFLLLSTLLHWLMLVIPPVWLLAGLFIPTGDLWPLIPAILTGLGLAIRGISALVTRGRLPDVLALPLSALLMTRIAAQALYWRYRGGVQWKGRTIQGS